MLLRFGCVLCVSNPIICSLVKNGRNAMLLTSLDLQHFTPPARRLYRPQLVSCRRCFLLPERVTLTLPYLLLYVLPGSRDSLPLRWPLPPPAVALGFAISALKRMYPIRCPPFLFKTKDVESIDGAKVWRSYIKKSFTVLEWAIGPNICSKGVIAEFF